MAPFRKGPRRGSANNFLSLSLRFAVIYKPSPLAPLCDPRSNWNESSNSPEGGVLSMKHCPECETDFPDSKHFCEFDGTSLVSDEPEAELKPDSDARLKTEPNVKMIAIAISGVVIGVILFLIYYTMTREPATQSSNMQSSNPSIVVPQQAALAPPAPPPVASASPSVEPSPSPSASPSPSPQTQKERRVELSSTAISTDQKTKSSPVIIRLNDGARIQSDEAWQTREGIWYRRGSVIALLDPKQVRAIEKITPPTVPPATPAASPSENPAPSPSQSPAPGTSQNPAGIKTPSQSSSRILTPPRRQH